MIGILDQPHRICRAGVVPVPLKVWHAHQDYPPEHVRPKQCAIPSDRRPPIVPDDNGLLLTQGVNDADNVGR